MIKLEAKSPARKEETCDSSHHMFLSIWTLELGKKWFKEQLKTQSYRENTQKKRMKKAGPTTSSYCWKSRLWWDPNLRWHRHGHQVAIAEAYEGHLLGTGAERRSFGFVQREWRSHKHLSTALLAPKSFCRSRPALLIVSVQRVVSSPTCSKWFLHLYWTTRSRLCRTEEDYLLVRALGQ